MSSVSVLHVVESYGGGVASAVRTYAKSVGSVEHHLLCRVRSGELASEGDEDLFDSVTYLPDGIVDALTTVRETVKRLRPNVVHAHSSLGGAITRLAILRNRTMRIVYTPHCYAFERLDISLLKRFFFRLAESSMAWNTSVVAACSPREQSLAKSLRPGQVSFHVPNVTTTTPAASFIEREMGDDRISPRIVVVGRIAEQKDPMFLIDVVKMLRARMDISVTWVGAGEPKFEAKLRDAGIDVTGWLSGSESSRYLKCADLLLHTASWEAMPIVFLEANAEKLPIVVRKTASLPWLGAAQSGVTVREVVDLAEQVLIDDHARSVNRSAWDFMFRTHTPDNQRRTLESIYRGKI